MARDDARQRCARCGRFKQPDGLLLCPAHGTLEQSARVTPSTAGDPTSKPSGTQKAKARKPGRKVIEAKLDRGIRSHDREADENREMVLDPGTDTYRQKWRDPDTDDVTFEKKGRLSDPNMHGRASHKRTKPKKKP